MVDKLRINEYLEDISQQLKDLKKLAIPNVDYLLNGKNFERRKAVERSLELAIQGVIHISCHLCAALGLKRLTDDAADAIIALGQENIIPLDFAKEIRGMVGFRNRLIHEYLPSEFDPHKLYENLQRLDDFRKFSHYIVDFLEKQEQESCS
jgi:uncharacterized protein YutE (UPF0331/DUF86 family)